MACWSCQKNGRATMIALSDFEGIYLHREPVDFRKAIDGLALIVEGEMKLSPFGNFLFIFCNRNRSRIKILYWDKTGFALWLKRLEKEKFPWPKKFDLEIVQLKEQELRWLLDGYEFWRLKPHSVVEYSCVS
jgi:transposase